MTTRRVVNLEDRYYLNVDVLAAQEFDRLGVVAPEGGVVERREPVLVLGIDSCPRLGQDLYGGRLSPALSFQVPLIGLVSPVPVPEDRYIHTRVFVLGTSKLNKWRSRNTTGRFIWSCNWVGLTLIWMFHLIAQLLSPFYQLVVSSSKIGQKVEHQKYKSTHYPTRVHDRDQMNHLSPCICNFTEGCSIKSVFV